MNVLGISCYYHDSCAALIMDGEVVAAAQEERFDREKYSPAFPIQAINYCLQEGGITILDVDEVAFYEKMYLKFERTIMGHVAGFPHTLRNFVETMPLWLKDRLAVAFAVEEELMYRRPIRYVKHHLSHAASSFLVSPFERAAVLTVDGVGEWACAAWGQASGSEIELRREMHYPHSLGLLYSIFTAYLGFRVFQGEGKVMALAEYGEDDFREPFGELLHLREDGSFHLDTSYFSFNRGEKMHTRKLEQLFGPSREEGAELTERHRAIACSLQRLTERVLLTMARHVHAQTGERHAALAGGCFLNVTANSVIRDEGPFEELFIQPAVGDAGAALGAAAYVSHTVHGLPRTWVMHRADLGPASRERPIEVLLSNRNAPYERLDEDDLVARVADALAGGRIVGWFQGRMELGPRALGQRSILAHPGLPGVKDELNRRIKHREPFRPFGASVLLEHVGDWFESASASPFMLMVHRVLPEKLGQLPAVTHENGTCRTQTVTPEHHPLYHKLISAFHERTGVPMVLNTSFNDREPIVRTPEEAWRCYAESRMDCLAIGPFFVERDHARG